MRKKQFCIGLDDNLKKELKEEATQLGLSLNSFIIMILKSRKSISEILTERNK